MKITSKFVTLIVLLSKQADKFYAKEPISIVIVHARIQSIRKIIDNYLGEIESTNQEGVDKKIKEVHDAMDEFCFGKMS